MSRHSPSRPRTRALRSKIRASVVVVAVACAGHATGAWAYGSALACAPRATSATFARWLDPAQYFPASNGGFEQGSQNWKLGVGAVVGSGNEPFHVNGAKGTHSLRLHPGASAESRTACVAMGEPTVRLLVDRPRVPGAVLLIDAAVHNRSTGSTLHTRVRIVAGATNFGWAPTPQIVIPNVLGGVAPEDLTLHFTTEGAPATWSLDDISVDPFKSY
jgi:hypothetical protein